MTDPQKHETRPRPKPRGGDPGMNASRVTCDFSKVLDTFRPDLAFVLIGCNDFWTEPVRMGRRWTRSFPALLAGQERSRSCVANRCPRSSQG